MCTAPNTTFQTSSAVAGSLEWLLMVAEHFRKTVRLVTSPHEKPDRLYTAACYTSGVLCEKKFASCGLFERKNVKRRRI